MGVALALVLLEVASLATMHGAINGIAARGQIGSSKGLSQSRETREQERNQRRDRLNLSRHLPKIHSPSFREQYPRSIPIFKC